MADLLQGVQDAANLGSGEGADNPQDFKMPSTEELLAAIEKMTGLSEENKKELIEGILERQKLGDAAGNFLPPVTEAVAKNTSIELLMLLAWILLVFLVIVFFGYKLYKSLIERERRREEKKKQKLQKKKK